MGIGPECCFGHQTRRKKYFQQGHTGEAIFSTKFSLRIVKYFDSLTVQSMAGVSFSGERPTHPAFTTAVFSREEKSVEKLLTTMESFINPFEQESDVLFNLVTKVVMPEKVKKDLCEQGIIRERLFHRFVEERIKQQKVTLWDSMKKQKPSTWKTAGKKVKLREDNTVELSEDRNLFARMMLVCKSRADIDIKEAVGTYEFSVVPRSLFAADVTLLHCSRKSPLMDFWRS